MGNPGVSGAGAVPRWTRATTPNAPGHQYGLLGTREQFDIIMKQEFRIPERPSYRVTREIYLVYLSPLNDVGWKLHVVKPPGLSVQQPDLPTHYSRLLFHLRRMKIPHKIVRSLAGLAEMERDPGQIGKFITIYPNDNAQLLRLPVVIDNCLLADLRDSHTARGDLPVGARGVSSARWGGLTSRYVVDDDNDIALDDRTRPHPDWLRNPFDPQSQGRDVWVTFNEKQQGQMDQFELAQKRTRMRMDKKRNPRGRVG
jgi:hypothetical protein